MKKLSLLLLVLAAFVTANAQPYLVGHRGSYWGVENTEEAFINGAKKGYHCLETDIKVTKDGKFVCWHDDNLTKASDEPAIASNTLATLQSICETMNISLAEFFSDDEQVIMTTELKEFYEEWRYLSPEKRKHLLQTMKYMK